MKPKNSKDSIFAIKFFIFLVFLLVPGLSFVLGLLSNKPAIRNYCSTTQTFIQQNQSHLESVFTAVFDDAKNCNGDPICENQISKRIFEEMTGKETLTDLPSTYFVRLSPDLKIQKLFLSGRYIESTADTKQEQQIVRLLQGRRGRICDQGWKIDGSELDSGLLGSRMRYLYDLYSEAEIILPVAQNDAVIGAVVKVWGD